MRHFLLLRVAAVMHPSAASAETERSALVSAQVNTFTPQSLP